MCTTPRPPPRCWSRSWTSRGRLLKLVWVDSAYQGQALAKAFARPGVRIEVVRRSDGQRESVVLARRWVVERTLSWLSRSRRLNRDHDRRLDHHAQMVWWAAGCAVGPMAGEFGFQPRGWAAPPCQAPRPLCRTRAAKWLCVTWLGEVK
ncbi:transposase [Streptomyces canus]|uniref:transposase n=1 Tax=Streptomyces canus TaxID=58343 RepID=UPI001CEC44F8